MGKRFTNITKQIRLITNNLGVLVSICNPSTQEVEAGRSEFTVSHLQRKKKPKAKKNGSALYDTWIYNTLEKAMP